MYRGGISMGVFFGLFIILWLLVTLFLPIKDMIEMRFLKTSGASLEVKVKDVPEKQQADDKPEEKKVKFNRFPKSGYCDVCSTMVKPHEAYLVPVDTFYDSEKYRKYLKKHPKVKSVIASKGIDAYIAEMRAQDKTEFSSICSDCVYMFE